ncbi:ATPase family associated with various cellular activities (AAA) [Paracoccus halophilus]|uniref:ATPase family associated with various cellular activities (AAA) n=1 Tax=Paracoccus halophilus TaxID=376733 RepID=A0A1I0UFV6_9RHOB|nr:ATP-binding protein [Paracoccus halophilus]SFA62667.1 ATPase family associated with various cellular activities (AAA) [Paracoccus halophilus]
MNAQDNLIPAWRAYADQVIHRLLAHRRDRALAANPLSALGGSDADPDDPGNAARSAAASAELPAAAPAAGEAITSVSAAPAQNPRPPEALPPRDLSLAIRLAATLGGEAACAPGAITVIQGLTPEELEPASRIITGAFLPPGIEAQSDPRRVTRGTDKTLILLAPEIRSGSDDRGARRQFPMTIEEALNHGLPLLLLLPDTGLLPEALHELASLLRLAPLSRAVLITHLAHSHGLLPGDEQAIHAALPPDRLLAGLTSTAFLLALRAPEAQDVVARLTRLTTPAVTDGPRLETMRGGSLALSTARRLVVDLQNWQAGWVTWNELSRSLLLYGPPGTGKTHLARAMGNSAGIALVTGSFAEWQAAGHLGDMLRAMRASFTEARRQAPAILFIDEIDAVGSREDGDRHGSSYRRQVINGFLAEMDMIAREPGVIVVGACNDPSRIDPAILRPGRFDLKVAVPLPDTSMIQSQIQNEMNDFNLLRLPWSCA